MFDGIRGLNSQLFQVPSLRAHAVLGVFAGCFVVSADAHVQGEYLCVCVCVRMYSAAYVQSFLHLGV